MSPKDRLEAYFDRLWPICRSITGPGFRSSLDILSELIPHQRHQFKTGEKVFDWTVPNEWHAQDAYFVGPDGKRRAEFKTNNLHLLGYSAPFSGTLPLSEFKEHLYSRPDLPDAIPYLTSYYKERWGFCLTHRELSSLPEGDYSVHIDTTLAPGRVEVAEAVLTGETNREILFSSYLCHPSLANNELSGPLALAFLYERIAAMPKRRYTYRFAIVPETIGSLCYLRLRGEHLKKQMDAGFLLTCIGDPGRFTYKRSRRGHTLADRAVEAVLMDGRPHEVLRFNPADGSDDRQYCSPGFDLPVGSIMRTMYGRYPEYHTSLDNKNFIRFDALADSVQLCFDVVTALESNATWKNTIEYGEPQLGKRGLYATLGSQVAMEARLTTLLWLLNLADGSRDLLTIASESGQSISALTGLAAELSAAGLLREVPA